MATFKDLEIMLSLTGAPDVAISQYKLQFKKQPQI